MTSLSESQRIGNKGEEWVRYALSRPGWIPTPPERDIGVDFNVVIDESSDLRGRQFQVQVKTPMSGIDNSQPLVKLHRIKVSTIRFWLLCPLPTLIVACDHINETAYFEWHSEYFGILDGKEASDTVTLGIPTKNELNDAGQEKIREDLRAYYGNLSTLISRIYSRQVD